jgi:hypothetical protein
MYCPSCGTALSQQMKYCTRCGNQLATTKDASLVESLEKRLRVELVEIFWATVIGLGLIVGGLVVMKIFDLSEWLIIAYMILSSSAFSINIALSLWQIRRLARSSREAKGIGQVGQLDTNELGPMEARTALDSVPSVTENTTSKLEV